MKHEKIKELLALYFDNELTNQEEQLIKEHLQNCQECQQELNQYQENQNLLNSLQKEKAPIDFVESILEKVDEDKKREYTGVNKKKNLINRIKDLFTLPVRMPVGIIALMTAILLISLTGLPGTLLNDNRSLDNDFQTRDELSFYRTTQDAKMQTAESLPEQNSNLLTDDSLNRESAQKIIKRANLVIELKNIEEINTNIINLVEKHNGYIANSRNWLNQNKQKFYWFELKIPAENFNQILQQLATKEYGQILSRSISSQDVTEEYIDLDIRLNNLLSQEERYRQLLDQASEVEEILKIENELNRVRTEIESLQGRKTYLDNQINFSTIAVEFHQPEPISSGTLDFMRAIRNAISNMVDHVYKIIIFIGTMLPYLFIFAIAYLFYRKFNRH